MQTQPSAAAFPGGESMAAMQARGVDAVRRHDAAVEAEHGPGAVWVAVSHGDLIKSILADALGMHLDLFQRLHVDPASISVVRYTRGGRSCWHEHPRGRPDLAAPAAAKKSGVPGGRHGRPTDAAVGGGAGPAAPA